MIVRLYKYLLPEYYSDFYASLLSWASRLQLVLDDGHRPEAHERDCNLRVLYGNLVLPWELLQALNNGLDSLTHYVEAGELAMYLRDREGLRMHWVRQLVEVRRKKELAPDEKPTLSRFFTLRENMDNLLTMDLIPDGHSEMIKLAKANPQAKMSKRMEWVTKLYQTPGITQYLRRTCLCLQVTGHLHNACAKEFDASEDEHALLVRMAQGRGRRVLRVEFAKAIKCMRLDKDLDVGAAISALLATVLDSVLRFAFFEAWPFLSCMLCMKYNDDYMDACMAFLHMSPTDLDVGFGQVLQRIALDQGTEASALNWLLSPTVQDTIVHVLENGAVSSLPVERKHTETKRFEQSRLVHLAVAARNQLHRQALRLQSAWAKERDAAVTELALAKRSNKWAIAFKQQPALADIGVPTRFGEPEGQQDAPEAPQQRQPDAPEPQQQRQHLAPETVRQRVRAFVMEHGAELEAARTKRIQDAKLAVQRLPPRDIPLDYEEWLAWLRANERMFRGLMKTATLSRRGFSCRFTAREHLPNPVARLQVKCRGERLPTDGWPQLLRGRWGWHGLFGGKTTHTIFMISYRGASHYLDMEPFRYGDFYRFTENSIVDGSLRPLSTLLNTLRVNAVEKVYEFVVTGRAAVGGVSVWVKHAVEITEALKPKKTADDDEDDDSDTDDSLEALNPSDDSEDSALSVDDDLDSGAASDDAPEEEPPEPSEPSDGEPDEPEPDEEERRPRAFPKWRGPRHAPHTWTIEESLWFYTTKTPGEIDLKCHMKGPWTTPLEMGHYEMTKTLMPYKFNETWEHPVRTTLLLRAWQLWRPRQRGWAAKRDSRLRHLEVETARLEANHMKK